MSRIVRSLCALPAFGALGTPTFIGGSTGETDTTDTTVDVTTIPGRSVNPPGTTMPPISSPADRIAFNVIDATYFDGSCALYGIPTWKGSADNTTRDFSASYWINISDVASPPRGHVFGFSNDTNWSLRDGITLFAGPLMSYEGVDGTVGGFSTQGNITLTNPAQYTYSLCTPHGFSAPVLSDGWVNVLFSARCDTVSRAITINLYCNDTPVTWRNNGDILDGTPISNLVVPDAHFFHYEGSNKFLFRFLNEDNAGLNRYSSIGGGLGGSYFPGLPITGNGFVGCLAEVWLGAGQFIDFSVLANRNKFHSSDLAQLGWAPVSLGADGSGPTGTKPLVYCTGRPDQIIFNRATGKKFRTYGELTLCTDAPPT